jgi:hypothetical protein
LYGANGGTNGGQVQQQQAAGANIPVKRTALTDSKTGMPIYHTYATNSSQLQQHLNQQHHQQHLTLAQHPHMAALNYQPINFPIQYISLPCKIYFFYKVKKFINVLSFSVFFRQRTANRFTEILINAAINRRLENSINL